MKIGRFSYLTTLALYTLQFTPFLDGLSQIDLTQGHFDLADLIVLGKSVEIKDGEHQSFVHGVSVWNSLRNKII